MATQIAHNENRPPPTDSAAEAPERDDDTDDPFKRAERVAPAMLPAAAGLVLIAVLGMALAAPDGSLAWAPVAVTFIIGALWWLSREKVANLSNRTERLADDNLQLAAELERVSDMAWELRESEERYRSLFDAQGDLVVRRDAKGRVTFLNEAFARTFGLDRETAIGASLGFGPPPARAYGPDLAATDILLDTPDGRRWFSWVNIHTRDDSGALAPYYSVLRDITARKQSEQALVDERQRAEAANRAKSQLLATVSHEFRTPLNGILGLTGLLNESGLTADQRTYADGVQTSGEALLTLVDDMLDFSRVEAGRLDLHPTPTGLEPLAEEIVELLAARAHAKGIDIAANVDPDLPAVLVDRARLRQVLINLAGNGVKFTDTGGVTIAAASVGRHDGEIHLRFTVEDTGPGVDPAEAERLFDEFEQSDNALTRRHGGAGLGLAISRRIVRCMGGDIRVEQGERGGARFSFTLRVSTTAIPSGRTGEAGPRLADARFMMIAVPGAEPPVMADQIAGAGAEMRVLDRLADASGLVAAAAAAGEDYQAVIVDARLPRGAAAALAEIREAAGSRIPAAVVIEPGGRGEIDRLRNAGFDAYLVRPVRRASLLRIAAQLAGQGDMEPAVFHADPGDLQRRKAPATARNGEPLDILLAEDNEINALLARSVLERLGHRVTEVGDGAAAVEAVTGRDRPFAVILMDLHMPRLDGLSAVSAIRAHESERGDPAVPVLAMTADVLAETRQAAEKAGVSAVLEKPMTPDSLRKALADIAES